jgi:hypothetical protein
MNALLATQGAVTVIALLCFTINLVDKKHGLFWARCGWIALVCEFLIWVLR